MVDNQAGPQVPRNIGADALVELGRVPWATLRHAYGIGRVGDGLHEDVAAALQALDRPGQLFDALEALASNVFHQGTIYEATPAAVGFMIAFAAGPEVEPEATHELLVLVANIAIASAWDAANAGFTDAFGEDIGQDTRAVIRASVPRLQLIAARMPGLGPLLAALEQLVMAERTTPAQVEKLLAQLDNVPELDDVPLAASAKLEPRWYQHPKWGRAELLGRDGPDKLRLRFEDGSERVILARFVEPIRDEG